MPSLVGHKYYAEFSETPHFPGDGLANAYTIARILRYTNEEYLMLMGGWLISWLALRESYPDWEGGKFLRLIKSDRILAGSSFNARQTVEEEAEKAKGIIIILGSQQHLLQPAIITHQN